MLDAHLRKAALSDATLDQSDEFGEGEGDRSVDAARVEYLFKADVPVSGMPHTSGMPKEPYISHKRALS